MESWRGLQNEKRMVEPGMLMAWIEKLSPIPLGDSQILCLILSGLSGLVDGKIRLLTSSDVA